MPSPALLLRSSSATVNIYKIYILAMTLETTGASAPDTEAIRDILRRVVDPELGANIVDLGLVYRIDTSPERVLVDMTMTSQACPMGDMILEDVRSALIAAVPETCRPEVRLVWEPPWTPDMMSERIKVHFGW